MQNWRPGQLVEIAPGGLAGIAAAGPRDAPGGLALGETGPGNR